MATFVERPSKLIDLLAYNSKSPNLNIVDTILFHLGIADIYALHGACRSLRWLVAHMTSSPSLLDVNKRLRSFVKDPVRFRHELGKHDALILSHFVRDFFEFGRWRPPLMLICVRQGPMATGFIDYLLREEGYRADPQRRGNFSCENFPERRISVVTTVDPPVVEIITKAYTTTGVDFISWNKAYSLFPVPTLARHKLYPLKPIDNIFGQLLKQIEQYGWTTRDVLWPDLTNEGIAPRQYRQVGDSSSLVIGLGNAPHGKFTPDHVLENAVFSVVQARHSDGKYLSIGMEPGRSIALRHEHTKGTSGPAHGSWGKFLEKRLNRWIYVEIAKMNPEQRPRGFRFPVLDYDYVSIPPNYEPPDTWDYADDQVGVWFQEWARSRWIK